MPTVFIRQTEKDREEKKQYFLLPMLHMQAHTVGLEAKPSGKKELTKHLKLHVYVSYSWRQLLAHSHIRSFFISK